MKSGGIAAFQPRYIRPIFTIMIGMKTTMAILAISEGWNCTGPSFSQRLAPLIFLPIGVKRTMAISTIEVM